MTDEWRCAGALSAPGRALLEHGIEYDEQFAHTGDEGHLLGLTSGQQPLVEVPDDGIESAGGQRSHVQDGSDPGVSIPDGAFATHGAAVPVEGSHSHQGGDLAPVQGAKLRQMGQKGEGELLSHAGNGAQEVVLLSPHGTLTESLPQPFVNVVELLLKPSDVGLDAGPNGADGAPKPVLLRHQDGYHLVPAGNQGVEDLGLGVPQRTHGWANGVGEVGQYGRVQGISLRQRTGGFGEVSGLPGV